ncbi:MAG TPA: oligosaccharide flippase family protein [Ignavibacteriaceae bacterium]|nr:oligosaccharide flippase family protein [Ignavibacteriaceae bacterium]
MLHKKSKQILRNIFSLTVGQTLITILSFLSITLAARFLGVENFGRFNYLLAIVVIVSRVIDLGLSPIVFRELSKDKNSFELLNSAIILRFFAFVITVFFFVAILFFTGFSLTEILLANILLFNTFISVKFIGFRELLDIPFKVNLKMHFPMLVAVTDNLLLLIAVILMPVLGGDLNFFIIAYVVVNIPGFVIILLLLKKKMKYSFSFSSKHYKSLLLAALPIYGFVILDVLYQQLDVILLKHFFDFYEIGIYSASLRLVVPLLFFPTALVHTFFPLINENLQENPNQNGKIITFVFKVLIIAPFILFIIFVFKSEDFVILIFGKEFIRASNPTAILLLAQTFVFFNYFMTNLTVAYSKQKWNFFFALYLLVSNFILNIFLIPYFNYEGAAFAKLLTTFTASILAFVLIKKIGYTLNLINFRMIAWLSLIGCSLFVLSYLNVYSYLFISIATIIISFLYSGVLDKNELIFLANTFKVENALRKLRVI